MDCSLRDERLCALVHVTLHTVEERGRGIEDILSVLHVEHGIARGVISLIVRRQVNDDVTVVRKNSRMEIVEQMNVAGKGMW